MTIFHKLKKLFDGMPPILKAGYIISVVIFIMFLAASIGYVFVDTCHIQCLEVKYQLEMIDLCVKTEKLTLDQCVKLESGR